MKTVRYSMLILLLAVILVATIIMISSKYFSWDKKEGFKIERQNKIKLVCAICIGIATVMLIIVWAI